MNKLKKQAHASLPPVRKPTSHQIFIAIKAVSRADDLK